MKKLLLFIFSLFFITLCNAQFTDIVNFNNKSNPKGSDPYGDVVLSGKTLFGMTPYGGANGNGVIFSVDTNGNNYKVLWVFGNGGNTNGSQPQGSLTISGGILYGMTYQGGVKRYGNIFSIDTNGSGYKDLWDFDGGGDTNGSQPYGNLTFCNGLLYGMTYGGGINANGNIFSIHTDGSGYKDLWDFLNSNTGSNPGGSLIFQGEKMYGMTINGGINGDGTVFSMDTNGSDYQDLWDFDGGGDTNGNHPKYSYLTLSKGVLYGMTGFGGINNNGNIFSIDTDGSKYKDLWDFDGGGDTNGSTAIGSLTYLNGILYGMTKYGGINNSGNIFSIHTDGSKYKDLWDFTGTDGNSPYADIFIAGNILYGTTSGGGGHGNGALFSFTDTYIITISTTNTNISCNGATTAMATASATGGVAPYTYLWSDANSQTTAEATGLSAGTYTITITDAISNYATAVVTITQPSPLGITANAASNVSCNGGNNGIASSTVTGGTAPYTYLWSDGNSQSTANATGLSAGTYTVSIQDNNACPVTWTSVIITQPSLLNITANVTSNVSCNGGNNGSASSTVTGGTAPYTYLWSDASSQSTANATGLSAGTYTVSIQDNNGCPVTWTSVIITQTAALTASVSTTTNETCYLGDIGVASSSASGGAAPYTYSWSSGNTQTTAIATGLNAGTWTVTITDNNNCTATASTVITEPAEPFSTTHVTAEVTCNGGNNGSGYVTVTGGTLPYTYSWAGGVSTTDTATGLSAGTYTVTVHDNCGVLAPAPVLRLIITQPAIITTTASTSANVTCNGGINGSATANVTGGTTPYTYFWSDANTQTTVTATGLSAGTYTVAVQDNHGCPVTTATAVITQPLPLGNSAAVIKNVSCVIGNNGSAYATPTGGTQPYTYSWAPAGGSSDTATGLIARTYTVTISDLCGSISTATVVITQPNVLQANAYTIANASCYGENDGTASVNVSYGTPPYTYIWFPSGETTATASGLSAGNYRVTVSDSCNSVTVITATTITEPAALVVTAGLQNDNGHCNGAAWVGVTGGITPYTYSWSPGGQTTDSIYNQCPDTVCFTVTDAHGCTESTCLLILRISTGINTIASASTQITAYPNPNDGKFTIQMDNGQLTINNGTPHLEIYNELGKQVFLQSSIVHSPLSIDLSSQPNGVYLYRVISESGTLLGEGKLIIQK